MVRLQASASSSITREPRHCKGWILDVSLRDAFDPNGIDWTRHQADERTWPDAAGCRLAPRHVYDATSASISTRLASTLRSGTTNFASRLAQEHPRYKVTAAQVRGWESRPLLEAPEASSSGEKARLGLLESLLPACKRSRGADFLYHLS